ERAAGTAVTTEGDDLLEAVFQEALRLHTVIAMVNRTLTRPSRVGGRDLPAGTTVAASILLVHESERWHEAPGSFRADRYLGNSPAPNTWVPFGGGARRCLGAGFAMMEGVEILRAVLRDCSVETVGTERPRVRNVTSVPARGAMMRIRTRRRG
ncbi:MAG: cytochrome P450, partial [Actinomycetota bacterium]